MTATGSLADFPLLIKSLLRTPLQTARNVEIVSDGLMRYSYQAFKDRLHRLAAGLSRHGIGAGDVVAVMDWDTHRYFEAFFAVPMMGAVLHTVNIRLAPAQIAYTIDHAEDDVILVHADFLPLLSEVMKLVTRKVRLVLLRDDASAQPESDLAFITSYDEMMEQAPDGFGFQDFDENTRATTFYTTGTTGEPKAVAYSHRQLVLHTMGCLPGSARSRHPTGCIAAMSICRSRRCFMCMPGDFPMRRPCLASSRSMRVAIPRRICCG